MADKTNRLTYVVEINDKGKVKIDGLTKSFVKAETAFKKLGTEVKKTTDEGLNPMIDKTGLAGATLVELGRTISDMPYGIRGIANNLSQLSTLFTTLIVTTGGFGNGLDALVKAFRGPLGIIVVFQAVIALLDHYSSTIEGAFKMTKSFGGAFEDIGSTVTKTAGKFEIYIRTLQDSNKSQEQQKRAIDGLNKEFPDFIKNLEDAGYETEDLKDKTIDLTEITNQYRDSLFELAMARAAQNKIESLAGEAIDARMKAETELLKMGLTLDEARELSAKRDEVRTREGVISVRKRVRNVDEFRTKEADAADKAIKNLDKENIRIQQLVNQLMEYTRIEMDDSKKRTKARAKESKEKNKYDALEIGNFDRKIRALKEMGQIREYFFNRNLEIDVAENLNTIEAIKLEEQQNLNRLNALKELGLVEAELAVAKYEINIFYSKLLAKEQEMLDRRGYAMRMEMFGHYADSLGSISGLMKENSKASKTFALLEIAANTAIGFSQGLTLAQQQAKEAAPVSALAFPLFYASQIAAVLAAANRAKSILSGGSIGGGIGGGFGGGIGGVEAPDFNVVGASPESQLAQSITGQQEKPLRAFVVNKDIKDAQELDRAIDFNRSLG